MKIPLSEDVASLDRGTDPLDEFDVVETDATLRHPRDACCVRLKAFIGRSLIAARNASAFLSGGQQSHGFEGLVRRSRLLVSVATVATRRVDRLQLLEVELDDGVQLVGQPRPFEVRREIVAPDAVVVL